MQMDEFGAEHLEALAQFFGLSLNLSLDLDVLGGFVAEMDVHCVASRKSRIVQVVQQRLVKTAARP